MLCPIGTPERKVARAGMLTVLKVCSTVVSGCPSWWVVPVLPGCSALRRGNTLGERSR
jgi:hypothetical protein